MSRKDDTLPARVLTLRRPDMPYEDNLPPLGEMLGDYYRWQQDKILSVLVQEMPEKPHDPTRLRILDFKMK